MEKSPAVYAPVEKREPAPQRPPGASVARVLRALLIEHRLPYRLQVARDRILHSIGFTTKTVKFDGLRFQVRRLAWDEGFLRHAIEREDYTKKGFSLRETDTVIDIGANIGAFSVYAAKQVPRGRVIAFEPASDNYEFLARNAALNRLNNLTPVRAAVAGQAGVITLYLGEASGVHSTTKGHLTVSTGTEEVEAISLEGVFERYKLDRCDLLKLNCEGAEFEILYSAPESILAKIQRIAMEYHAKENKRQKANEMVDYLRKHGFEVVEYTDYVDLDCGFLSVQRVTGLNT